MKPVIVALDERLASTGAALVFQGTLDEPRLSLSSRDFALPEGVSYDVVLTNAGDGILVTGIVRARAVGECDRCLEPAELSLSGEVDEYFLFRAPDPSELGEDEDESDFALVAPDRTVDLADCFTAALTMEVPFVVLCKPDCKGLCPVCGENLNLRDCGHGVRVRRDDEVSASRPNPFAALRDVDFGDGSRKGE